MREREPWNPVDDGHGRQRLHRRRAADVVPPPPLCGSVAGVVGHVRVLRGHRGIFHRRPRAAPRGPPLPARLRRPASPLQRPLLLLQLARLILLMRFRTLIIPDSLSLFPILSFGRRIRSIIRL